MTTTLAARPSVGTRAPSLLLVAGVVGPLLFLAGQALLPSMSESMAQAFPVMVEHRDQLMAARLLTAAGAFLLAPAAVVYARVLRRGTSGHQLLQVGAWVLGIATFCNALSQAVSGYATWTVTAPGFDAASAQDVVERIETGLVALPLGFWAIPAFALGALLMAVALFRSRAVPTWLPVLLTVGTVLAMAFAGQGYLVALTQAPFTAALIVMALRPGDGVV